LRCIGGLSSRWRGEMLWCGAPIARRRSEFAAAAIYLGHALGLKAALSARENLQWWTGLRGIDSPAAIDTALERVGLCGYEDSACYQLSAGQQRRVGLARLFLTDARSTEKQLWILDEPFTAIDRRGAAELERWIAAHAVAGGAVLLTSHQPLSLPQLRAIALRAATLEAEAI
jgi:heme exporter protein A